MAPTSVSSRFKARPVMPFPKSSISLSIAPVRPSIFATPSPISRTVPTFCRAVAVLTPEIWASISCNKVLISFVSRNHGQLQLGRNHLHCFKRLFQSAQPSLHAPIKNIATNLDAQSANQGGILRKGNIQSLAIGLNEVVAHFCLQFGRE